MLSALYESCTLAFDEIVDHIYLRAFQVKGFALNYLHHQDLHPSVQGTFNFDYWLVSEYHSLQPSHERH
jgi:hypothetical protein